MFHMAGGSRLAALEHERHGQTPVPPGQRRGRASAAEIGENP